MTDGNALMTLDKLAEMRENYTLGGLDEADLAPTWLSQFDRWLAEAIVAGVTEPNAMVLATAGPTGRPASRTVLAKGVDAEGVVFYTNYTSAKSHDLDENPWASVTFPWYQLQRQVHFKGRAHRVDQETALAYWRTRPRISQIGAWSSPQSTVVSGREELDRLQQHVEDGFGGRDEDAGHPDIPLPPHWGGWRIQPATVEFWQGRSGRMHDRLRYRRIEETGPDDQWVVERLAP
jgi:pyridoxamine 5'-phosphate oxidase